MVGYYTCDKPVHAVPCVVSAFVFLPDAAAHVIVCKVKQCEMVRTDSQMDSYLSKVSKMLNPKSIC